MTLDTSLFKGWEAVETFDGNIKANGRWNQEEKVYHINNFISQEYVQQIDKYSYHNTNFQISLDNEFKSSDLIPPILSNVFLQLVK
jgi:hypothetical protein